MDIQSTKIKLVKAILDIESEEFIQKVVDFIDKEQVDFWNELSISEQDEIKKGLNELDQGKRIPFESF